MIIVLAGLVVCVIVMTFSTGYITQDTRNTVYKDSLANSERNGTMACHGGDYIFSCENIDTIKLLHILGIGVDKKTYLGEYGQGTKVAVKMLSSSSLMGRNGDRLKMFMKEILLLQELKHRNILRLLGFCIRGDKFGTESLRDEGAIAVYEYGEDVHNNISFFSNLPLSQSLDLALAITDLFMYLERSPLGSMKMRDLVLRHFMWHENTLKLIDVDGDWEEPPCRNRFFERCRFNLTCEDGRCVGYNAKRNLLRINKVLLGLLLANADILAIERSTTGPSIMPQRGLRPLKQLIWMLNEHFDHPQVTFAWVRRQLLDVRSAL